MTAMPWITPAWDGVAFLTVMYVFCVLAITAVGGRLWGRRLIGISWALDDYLALASLIVYIPTVPIITLYVGYGGFGGRDLIDVVTQSPNAVSYGLMMAYTTQYMYGFSVTAIKLSVLAFYWRVFPTTTVRTGVYILGFLSLLWFVVITFINALECKPVSFYWTQSGDGVCYIDSLEYFEWNSLANSLIDLFTVVLPVHEVARLQMSTSKKLGIISIFLLGSIAVIASTTRLVSVISLRGQPQTNVTKQYVLMGAATMVETFVAIIGACSVTLKPVFLYLRYGDPTGSTASSAPGSGQRKPTQSWAEGIKTIGRITGRGRRSNSFEMLDEEERGRSESQTEMVASVVRRSRAEEDVAFRGVAVERAMHVTSA